LTRNTLVGQHFAGLGKTPHNRPIPLKKKSANHLEGQPSIMQVGFGGVNVAPAEASVLNAEQSTRRVSGQATEHPVREPSEAEPRAREEVEARDARDREVFAPGVDDQPPAEEAGTRDEPGRRVGINV
jgi:hypothetical protein